MAADVETRHVSSTSGDPDVPRKLLESNLFCDKRYSLYNSNLPFRVTHANLALACETSDLVVSSESDTGNYTGVSFGSCIRTERGPSLTLHLYCGNTRSLFLHIGCHLQKHRDMLSELKGGAHFELCFPVSVPTEEIRDVISPVLGEDALFYEGRSLIIDRPL